MPRGRKKKADPVQPEVELNSPVDSPAVTLTTTQIFDAKFSEIEEQIVSLFACGASLFSLCKRFPTLSEQEISNIVVNRLKVSNYPSELLPGMQIFGFNDDLRVLTTLIQERDLPAEQKIKALKQRTDTRSALIDFLRAQGLLFDVNSGTGGFGSENSSIEKTETHSVKYTFENLKSPQERIRFIECLEKGIPYVPIESTEPTEPIEGEFTNNGDTGQPSDGRNISNDGNERTSEDSITTERNGSSEHDGNSIDQGINSGGIGFDSEARGESGSDRDAPSGS